MRLLERKRREIYLVCVVNMCKKEREKEFDSVCVRERDRERKRKREIVNVCA